MTEASLLVFAPAAFRYHDTMARWLVYGCIVLLGGGLAYFAYRTLRSNVNPETKASPYRNTSVDVRYVGDETCARCHPAQTEGYRRHPMGRSLTSVAGRLPLERFDASAGNPFNTLGYHFAVEVGAGSMTHKAVRADSKGAPVAEENSRIEYIMGSGVRGRSYLMAHDGYLFQSPISWFSQKNAWDLSPGFEHFYPPDRVVERLCLFCHANQVQPIGHTRNRYQEPIFQGFAVGCERCHGPGELHVRARENGEAISASIDDTIVNPESLPPNLRESVCQQCHLQGEQRLLRAGHETFDFRPGLPLEDFWAVFVADNSTRKAVGQVEQMYESRCFRDSKGELGCISCHDPHDLPAPEKAGEYYRGRCLHCHNDSSCSLPLVERKLRNDHCSDCHMPRLSSSDIVHTAAKDHRILRDPKKNAPPLGQPDVSQPGSMPIASFFEANSANKRDLGIALLGLAEQPGPRRQQIVPLAVPLLDNATASASRDLPLLQAHAWLLALQGDETGARQEFDKLLTLAPDYELVLGLAATLAERALRPEAAIGYLRRAVMVNPWMWDYRYPLARLLADKQEWHDAYAECAAALRLSPGSDETRTLFITCCLHVGKAAQAKAELEKLIALRPKEERTLRSWFAAQAPEKGE
jgi:tetratricopeptide (TPR) repeat protein